jgi:hypothetical protein
MEEGSRPDANMSALAARVERLERQNRWLMRTLVIVAAAAAFLVAIAAAAKPDIPDVVTAKSFQIVDNDGKIRGELGFTDDGAQGLVLRDPDGKERALIAVSPDGFAAMRLFGATGDKSFAGITVSPHGSGLGLAYLDADGNYRVGLDIQGESPDQTPSLKLFDKDGKELFSAPPK